MLWMQAILALFLLASAQDDPRIPVPDAAAQKEAEKLIRDVFKDDYAKKGIAERSALAKKLFQQGMETKDDATSRFVLFQEAAGLFAQAGDLEQAFKSIDQLKGGYRIDPTALKNETLLTISKSAKTPDDFQALAKAYLKVSQDAADANDYAAAEKAVASAATQAKKAQNLVLINRTTARSKEIADLKARFEKLKKAREALTSNPDDPTANLAVGQYECFTKGNWDVGLPLLAKGSDASIQALAGRDLARPTEVAELVTLGDGWWDLGEKETGPSREILRRRAGLWYEKAGGKLTGLSATKVQKRLHELRMESFNKGNWLNVSDPKLFGKPGTVLDLPNQANASLSKFPAGEFDGLSVRVRFPTDKSSSICIEYEPEVHAIFLNLGARSIMTSTLEGTTWKTGTNKACGIQEEYLVAVLIAEGDYVGFLDGREIFRVRTQREHLAGFEFGMYRGSALLDQIRLRRKE